MNANGDFSDHTGSTDAIGIISAIRNELSFMKDLSKEDQSNVGRILNGEINVLVQKNTKMQKLVKNSLKGQRSA